MATIHLMCGFMGFGKTTIAKQIEKNFSAVRFTHDEIMLERYGREPNDFQAKYKIVDDFILNEAEKCIKQGQNVVLDYGLWTHEKREKYYKYLKIRKQLHLMTLQNFLILHQELQEN